MHIAFAISAVIQVALAVHAYQHGRVRPWIWIILVFPVIGSLIYTTLFLWPSWKRRLFASSVRSQELRLRPVARGPFAKTGDRPDRAIRVRAASDIPARVERDGCPDCEGEVRIAEQRQDSVAGLDLEVVVLACEECGAMPVRYFAVQGG